MNLPADHPVWPLFRTITLVVLLGFVLWSTASDFDLTEVRTIILMMLLSTGIELVGCCLQSKDKS